MPIVAFEQSAAARRKPGLVDRGHGGVRRGRASQQGSQRRGDSLARGRLFRIERFPGFRHHADQQADMVAAFEQQLDKLAVDGQRAFAHLVERILDDMGKRHDRVEPEQARGALDGVRGAKHGVDRFLFLRLAFEPQQDALHFIEQPAAFLDIGLQCLIHAHSRLLDIYDGCYCRAESSRGSPNWAAML